MAMAQHTSAHAVFQTLKFTRAQACKASEERNLHLQRNHLTELHSSLAMQSAFAHPPVIRCWLDNQQSMPACEHGAMPSGMPPGPGVLGQYCKLMMSAPPSHCWPTGPGKYSPSSYSKALDLRSPITSILSASYGNLIRNHDQAMRQPARAPLAPNNSEVVCKRPQPKDESPSSAGYP